VPRQSIQVSLLPSLLLPVAVAIAVDSLINNLLRLLFFATIYKPSSFSILPSILHTMILQKNQFARVAFLASFISMVEALISPSSTTLPFMSRSTPAAHARTPTSYMIGSEHRRPMARKRKISKWCMSSTDSLEADSVFEDIDGIGERTGVAQKAKNEISMPCDSNVEAASLVDPAIVVEEILANAVLLEKNLEEVVETAVAANGISSPTITAAISSPSTPVDQGVYTMEERIEAPKLSKIIKFAIPAVGVWMCSPLLSLIDTSCVGLLSGTAQQAALNPAVAVTDYSALLVAFMYTATTNLVAGAKESEKFSIEKPRTSKTLIQS
jgi:hypothetical protein